MWRIHFPPHLICVSTLPCKNRSLKSLLNIQYVTEFCTPIRMTVQYNLLKLLILNTLLSEFISNTLKS